MGWNRVVVVLFLALSVPAFAQHAEDARVMARDRYQAGEAKFRAGDYRGAIAEFRAADLLFPAPMNSYNVALAHERLNELDRAAQAYREYLSRRPDAPNRAAVEARISALEATAQPPAPPVHPERAIGEADASRRAAPAPDSPPVARVPYDPLLARRVPDRTGAVSPVSPEAPTAQPEYPQPQAQQPAYPPTPEPQGKKASRPFYKHWAFWVVVGVGAVILIDLAVGNSGTDEATPVMNPGAVIFRF